MNFNLKNFIAVIATLVVAILILTASFGGGSPRAGVAFLTGANENGSKMVQKAQEDKDAAERKQASAEGTAEKAKDDLKDAKKEFSDSLCIQRDTITSRDSTIAKQTREIAKLKRELKLARAGANCISLPAGAHFDIAPETPTVYFYRNRKTGEQIEFSTGPVLTGILGTKAVGGIPFLPIKP